MSSALLFHIEQDIAYLSLNRPAQGNAINLPMAQALLQAAIHCDQNPQIRCVLLSAEGRLFCAGGDITDFSAAQTHIPHFLSELAGTLHLAISRFKRMAKPVLVAVNGSAAGAGMSLALIGDLVLASEQAQFSPAYAAIGLSPDAGLTWHLPQLVGLRKAQQILLLNQTLSAQQALNLQLISQLCSAEDLPQQSRALARQLADSAVPALGQIKQLLLQSGQNSLETHLELEARAIAAISVGAAAKEGLAAYLHKRPAQFNQDEST
jgi:2-(1,2-epoxy-1,2-dihydrophenyl)acetyl-CoA isomerase